MERWSGKVALVTGASAGMGASITEELAKAGVKVFGMARRVERVEELKQKVGKVKGEIIPIKGDVAKEEDVAAVFKTIKEKFGAIHILVNNAGLGRYGTISEGKIEWFRDTFNVNTLGLVICTQYALKLMKESGVDDGHIIHINSCWGHSVPNLGHPVANVIPASKYAVTALTESLRQELVFMKSKIRVTSISPGHTDTEVMAAASLASGLPEKNPIADGIKSSPSLKSKDIADAVLYVLSTPPHVQVHELMIKPVGEAWYWGCHQVELAKAGVKVFGLARRVEKIEELKKSSGKVKGEIIPLKGDIAKEDDILAAFKVIKEKFGKIHILVNNAGIVRRGTLSEGDTKIFREVFDVNVMGLTICTQQALKLMKAAGVDDGHIIHINSLVGHFIPNLGRPDFNVYPASKYAVTALTESLRQELNHMKTKIKITSISPGYTKTEIQEATLIGSGMSPDVNDSPFEGMPALSTQDLAESVLYVFSTPPHVKVHELMIMPVGL